MYHSNFCNAVEVILRRSLRPSHGGTMAEIHISFMPSFRKLIFKQPMPSNLGYLVAEE